MDFFNKIGDSIQNVGKEVSKKTKDIGETMSLNTQIKEYENTLNRIYQQIGQKYLEEYKEEASNRYMEETQQVEQIKEKMIQDKAQLRALKGLKLCPECGADIELQFPRCPMCGAAVEVPKVEQQVNNSFCPGCGSQIAEGTKFCGKCGMKIG